jgi:hypothetical protein
LSARPLTAAARLFLWDYPRASRAYVALCLLLLLVLLLVPGGFWGDPMGEWPR